MTEQHLRLLHEQQQIQAESLRQQRRDAKIEEAYESLSQWLHALRRTIDEIWEGCCASVDGEEIARAKNLLSEWPWETLRTPAHIAPMEIYWSSQTWKAIREFHGNSHRFTTRAWRELDHRKRALAAGEKPPPGGGIAEPWTECQKMWAIIDNIRDQVRKEMTELYHHSRPV